jgi:exodeoxyribonuclease VII large subunit
LPPAPRQIVDFDRDIWTVSRLNTEARAVLEGALPLLWIQGEISNLAEPRSGHCYFTLKDPGAQVRCAMFRQRRQYLSFRPANGQQVLLRARLTLYEQRGDFQLKVEHMEPAGEGALRLELERRKRRLAALGLFDEARKRPLPALPRQIGLITSASGAAVHDLLTVLGRRLALVPVLIYPVPVQGERAAEAIIEALALANRRADCDLLILARGGGSLEDLMAFNDEQLAHAIRASDIPVLTGIGHEVDFSIADLAADRRAATPSAAAELAVPSVDTFGQRLASAQRGLASALAARLRSAGIRLEKAIRALRLLHPRARLAQLAQTMDLFELQLTRGVRRRTSAEVARLQRARSALAGASPRRGLIEQRRRLTALAQRLGAQGQAIPRKSQQRLAGAAGRLEVLNPLAVLRRGFAIVTRERDGRLVRAATDAVAGDALRLRLAEAELRVRVEPAAPREGDPAPAALDVPLRSR